MEQQRAGQFEVLTIQEWGGCLKQLEHLEPQNPAFSHQEHNWGILQCLQLGHEETLWGCDHVCGDSNYHGKRGSRVVTFEMWTGLLWQQYCLFNGSSWATTNQQITEWYCIIRCPFMAAASVCLGFCRLWSLSALAQLADNWRCSAKPSCESAAVSQNGGIRTTHGGSKYLSLI